MFSFHRVNSLWIRHTTQKDCSWLSRAKTQEFNIPRGLHMTFFLSTIENMANQIFKIAPTVSVGSQARALVRLELNIQFLSEFCPPSV